jgi:predicted nucleic acid-binding protein
MKQPKKVYLIDTNIILRFLLGDHPELSPKATAFMSEVSNGTIKAEILDVGIVNSNRSELLQALLKFETSNADIVDCVLAAMSSPARVVVSFDKDMLKLKAATETL